MHLIIYFYGTGKPFGTPEQKTSNPHGLGQNFGISYSPTMGYENIATINVYGCTHPEVCDAFLFPNLRKFAQRFVDKLLSKEKNTLSKTNLEALKALGIGIDTKNSSTDLTSNATNSEIESITLVGYSRGAVTCFNVAQELNQVAPHIPVNIVAAEPVPGNLYAFPGSNAANIADCSSLGNLQNVSVIIGAHSAEDNVFIQNAYFSQIVPKLPPSINTNIILTPALTHQDTSGMTGALVQVELAKCLNSQNALGDGGTEHVDLLQNSYAERYQKVYEQSLEKKRKLHYPLAKKMQKIFGLDRDTLLKKHKETQHPSPLIAAGYELDSNKSLIDWWRKHDKKIISPHSALTKKLIKEIRNCNINKKEEVLSLYKEAESWLLKKAFTSTARYENVLQLRNVLYDRLINEFKYSKSELAQISSELQQKTNYFAAKWQRAILATGPLTKEAKGSLAVIFAEHAKESPSFERERELMRKIDTWATQQDHSKNPKLISTTQLFQEEMKKMTSALYPKQANNLEDSPVAIRQSKSD